MNTEQRRITPTQYRTILRSIELKRIVLRKINAELKPKQIQKNVEVTVSSNACFSNIDDGFQVLVDYQIVGKHARKILFKILCTFELDFSTSQEIDNDFFEIYKEVNLQLNLWPYLRELISSITSRMGIHPLTLPLFKAIPSSKE